MSAAVGLGGSGETQRICHVLLFGIEGDAVRKKVREGCVRREGDHCKWRREKGKWDEREVKGRAKERMRVRTE